MDRVTELRCCTAAPAAVMLYSCSGVFTVMLYSWRERERETEREAHRQVVGVDDGYFRLQHNDVVPRRRVDGDVLRLYADRADAHAAGHEDKNTAQRHDREQELLGGRGG